MIFAAIAFLLVGTITMTIGWRPGIGPKARPLTARKFDRTPERLKRGECLVENMDCIGCHGGRALFPFMPYLDFAHMSDEDLTAVIVYLRSLLPVHWRVSGT
jgi:hypothetical protein